MVFGRLFRLLRGVVGIVLLALVVYLFVTGVQVLIASTTSRAATGVAPARAIVVVGTTDRHAKATGQLAARCSQAIDLFRAHRGRLVFTTGASSEPSGGGPSQASLAAACLELGGVPSSDVVELPEENIAVALQDVAAHYGSFVDDASGSRPRPSVVLVAAPLQVLWLGHLAAAEGLAGVVSPALASKGTFFSDLGQISRQTLAVALGRVIGYPNTVGLGN